MSDPQNFVSYVMMQVFASLTISLAPIAICDPRLVGWHVEHITEEWIRSWSRWQRSTRSRLPSSKYKIEHWDEERDKHDGGCLVHGCGWTNTVYACKTQELTAARRHDLTEPRTMPRRLMGFQFFKRLTWELAPALGI